MMVPMPVTWAPDRVIVSIRQAADPLRPPDRYGFQLPPVAATHRATSCWPGGPNRPAAVKPAASAGRAVKLVHSPGELTGTCCEVAPPSVDSAANGTAPGSVPVAEPTAGPFPIVPWPRATTRLPLTATCWSAPADAPPGAGMTSVFHDRPLVVIHAAGWLLCEPTETNPCGVAATASTWLEPVARFTSCARVQLVMLADHQTSATQPPPAATSRPTTTYPAGPEIAATAETPARSWGMFPPATPQPAPPAEVSPTGPGAPAASQPAGPCVTLVSARRWGSAATSPSEETRVQGPAEGRRHTAV